MGESRQDASSLQPGSQEGELRGAVPLGLALSQGAQVRRAFLLSWKSTLSPIRLPDIISQSLFYFLMDSVSGFP